MDSLEDLKYLASNNQTAEKVLYYLSGTLAVLDIVASAIWIALWLLDDRVYPIDFVLLVGSLCATIFFWGFAMVFLKISNLLRHIYNRLDDSVLNAEEKQEQEETEE